MNLVYGMPRADERRLTASSRDCGSRMLSWAVFGSNSNRVGLRPERSYSVRSAVATKCSASASDLKVGIFFFIAGNLLFVHVAGADRANQRFSIARPSCEDQEHRPSACRLSDRSKAFLALRVGLVGHDEDGRFEERFDLLGGNAMLPALRKVAVVPVEPGYYHP